MGHSLRIAEKARSDLRQRAGSGGASYPAPVVPHVVGKRAPPCSIGDPGLDQKEAKRVHDPVLAFGIAGQQEQHGGGSYRVGPP